MSIISVRQAWRCPGRSHRCAPNSPGWRRRRAIDVIQAATAQDGLLRRVENIEVVRPILEALVLGSCARISSTSTAAKSAWHQEVHGISSSSRGAPPRPPCRRRYRTEHAAGSHRRLIPAAWSWITISGESRHASRDAAHDDVDKRFDPTGRSASSQVHGPGAAKGSAPRDGNSARHQESGRSCDSHSDSVRGCFGSGNSQAMKAERGGFFRVWQPPLVVA